MIKLDQIDWRVNAMRTLVSKEIRDIQGHDNAGENQLIVPDLVTLLAHPVFTGESLKTLQKMAPDIEVYLRSNLTESGPPRLVNQIGAFLFRRKKPAICTCRTHFEHELEVLRQMRPELEAAIEAIPHLVINNRQIEAHLVAFNAKIPNVLKMAIEYAVKKWFFEVLGVHVQIWGRDISSKGFSRQTFKITKVAVPSEGLRFLVMLTKNNNKLPRRSIAPWVQVKGIDPVLVYPIDIGTLCGDDAIQVAVHIWN